MNIIKMYQRLRDLREDKDMTQKQIAEILNDSQQHYQLYESGKREPPFYMIIKLAKFYKVSIDYIAGLTNSKGGLYKNNEEEKGILNLYNSLDQKKKGKAELFLEQLAEQQEEENAKNKERAQKGTLKMKKFETYEEEYDFEALENLATQNEELNRRMKMEDAITVLATVITITLVIKLIINILEVLGIIEVASTIAGI